MAHVTNIKNKIKAHLDALKLAGTLGEVQMDDYNLGIFDRDYGAYPVAVLTVPAISADYLTNRQNIRTYTFEIVFILKAENIASATEIETLVETILDRFDNDPTLTGSADGAVEPSASSPQATVSRGKTYVAFVVTLKARAVTDLTF